MSNPRDHQEPRTSSSEDEQLQLIDEACERLLRAMTQEAAVSRPAPTRTETRSELLGSLRKAPRYVAVATTLLLVGSVGAQDTPTMSNLPTASLADPATGRTEQVPLDDARQERLEEAAEAREEAREARQEEREEFDENAADRAERRQDAREARWESLAEQGGLRSPTQLSSEALAELRTHARREARLRAIRYRAESADDTETVTRTDAVLEREALRHDVALSQLLSAPREHSAPEATQVTKAPTAEPAQPTGGAQ